LALPSASIDFTNSRASTFGSESAVISSPSGSVMPPPACTMKAPMRSRVSPSASPVCLPVVSFPATSLSSSQVVGTSASVSPAASHAAVLICRPSVEKSFGAQTSSSSKVKVRVSAS
jgi:hypothetical protein